MQTTNEVIDYITKQLAEISEEKTNIELEKIKIGYLKQRNNVEKNAIDRGRLDLKIKEFELSNKSVS